MRLLIERDFQISAWWSDQMVIEKKNEYFHLVEFLVPADHRLKKKYDNERVVK